MNREMNREMKGTSSDEVKRGVGSSPQYFLQ